MNLKEQAKLLRRQGYSYSYISQKTGLSKSTLSYHLASIPYQPNNFTVETVGKARAASAETKAKQKQKTLQIAQLQAKKDVGIISKRDLFILGLGLYIGEGSKTQDTVRLVNADAKVIKLFIRWLMMLGLKNTNIMMRIHLYPDSNIQKAESYWLQETQLPRSQLQPACVDKRANKNRKRSGTHTYGTAHVTVRANGTKEFGVALARRISAYMQEVLE